MGEGLGFDHIHLISRDPKAAADWYREMFGGEITAVQENLRGAPQIDVRVAGMTVVIRGQRPGEQPADAITPEDQLRIDVVGWCIEGFNDLEAAG